MSKEGCSIEVFATQLRGRIAEGKRNAQEDFEALSRKLNIEISSLLAEQMAKERGMWMDVSAFSSQWTPMPSGVENDVYLSGDGNFIYKVNNLMTSKTVIGLFDRLICHNALFPQTHYELFSFTGFGKGSVYPILRQDFINYEREATPIEIDTYMSALGFERIKEGAYRNKDFVVSDLHPRNVLRDNEGDIFVVDCNVN